MAAKKAASRKTSRSSPAGAKAAKGKSVFTADEQAAAREAVRERRARTDEVEGERPVLAAIAKMPPHDRALASQIHALVTSTAPTLVPRTWYGMPAYSKDGNVLCFFQNASKFKVRYATFGFSDEAALDEGSMWPTVYALQEFTPAVEARLRELLKKALGLPVAIHSD
jgi:uncharacterized protein YdhG (YjbR/CyaY superfamily)